jgi:hypothetical protein
MDGIGSVIVAGSTACAAMDRTLDIATGLFRLGRTAPNNFPLMLTV